MVSFASSSLFRVSVRRDLRLPRRLTFGRWIDHKTWSELLANYNVARGKLWPFVLASIVASPFIWGRARPSQD
jgi:hypothetical protein